MVISTFKLTSNTFFLAANLTAQNLQHYTGTLPTGALPVADVLSHIVTDGEPPSAPMGGLFTTRFTLQQPSDFSFTTNTKWLSSTPLAPLAQKITAFDSTPFDKRVTTKVRDHLISFNADYDELRSSLIALNVSESDIYNFIDVLFEIGFVPSPRDIQLLESSLQISSEPERALEKVAHRFVELSSNFSEGLSFENFENDVRRAFRAAVQRV